MPRLRAARHLPPASTRQRIGIFGGSFDPPHSGHMHVARTALKRLNLDQIWWVPARGNPLKAKASEFAARLAAVQVMTASHRAMRVSDIEQHAHLTYTIDLVRLWKAHCPHARLVWLMGADSLAGFDRWKEWRAIAELIPIGVIARPGATLSARNSHFAQVYSDARIRQDAASKLASQRPPAWVYLSAPLNRASSTALRNS